MVNPFDDPKLFFIKLWSQVRDREAIQASVRDVARILLKPRLFFQTESIDPTGWRPLIFLFHILILSGFVNLVYLLVAGRWFGFLLMLVVGFPLRLVIGVAAALTLSAIAHFVMIAFNWQKNLATVWAVVVAGMAVILPMELLTIPFFGLHIWLPPLTIVVAAWIVAHGVAHHFDLNYQKTLWIGVGITAIICLSQIYSRMELRQSQRSFSGETGSARDFLRALDQGN